MPSLLRFAGSTERGPSGALWGGIVDWVSGSMVTDLGARDFDDFAPYNAGNETIAGTTGAAASLVSERDGVIGVVNLTADAGANAEVGAVRNLWTDLDVITQFAVMEWRLRRNDSADAQFTAMGLTDQVGSAVIASNALAISSNQDFLGYRWNNDGTIDMVAVVAGTLTELVDTVATVVNGSATGYTKIGLKIQRTTSLTYRLTPCINGVIIRAKATNVASTAIPLVLMRPAIVAGTDATTAPSLDRDWFFYADK